MPGPGQNSHFRRASSQSQHGEMPMAGGRGGYQQGSGRGRNYSQGYNPQGPQSFSPGPGYRQMQGQPRPGSHFPPHVQGQMHPGPPHGSPRSPGPMPSNPGTPTMQHMQMAPQGQHMQYPPSYNGYSQQLGQPGQYNMQPGYDPNYAYYQQQYGMQPNYIPQGPPQSPRFNKPPPHQQFQPGQAFQPPSQAMSRTSSQMSERPASSIGSAQPPQPTGTPATNLHSHTPSQSVTSAVTPSSNFTIPTRAKSAIIIKNADGEVVTFDKKPSMSVPKSTPPPHVAATPTPPPAPATPSHNRNDSKSGKTAAEIKAEFAEKIKQGQQTPQPIKEEAAPPVVAPVIVQSESSEQESKEEKTEPAVKEAEKKVESAIAETKIPIQEVKAVSEDDAVVQKTATEVEATAKVAVTEPIETDGEREKREKEEEIARWIAEDEANEREEEEREKAYQAKKKAQKEAQAKEDAANSDEAMKRAEREAEALEEKREKDREGQGEEEESDEAKAEREKIFASLKKPMLGPGAETAESPNVPDTPTAEDPISTPISRKKSPMGVKPKPAALKLETSNKVEPAAPTPGMRSLRSARMLQLQSESVIYPEGIQSPNPALNSSGRRGGKLYDKDFLMQFQDAFKEKPSLDWDQKVKDTVGDKDAPPHSARTPGQGSRSSSNRGPSAPSFGAMGTFGQGGPAVSANRIVPKSSEQRAQEFAMGKVPSHVGPGSARFPAPAGVNMSNRQGSTQGMSSGRNGMQARGPSKGNDNRSRGAPSNRKEQEQANKRMELTASGFKPLEGTGVGWKPFSAGKIAPPPAIEPSGMMAPDMVQRKVKSNLNKMTPERFDKIAGQILEIASQSRKETDGRTLRQVIALTFEKACDEAHWASMYAKFAKRMLEEMSPEITDENARDKSGNEIVGGPLFRKYLLNRCQEEFEHGWENNLPDKPEGQTEEIAMLSDDYYIAAAAKRKGLGLIQFIGELYKLGMLSIRIMHQCFTKLLDFEGMADEAAIESLVKLLRTVGYTMNSAEQGPGLLKTYFERISKIMATPNLPSRMHFMLLDVVDLQRAGWRSKDDSKGPKTIVEIREEAAAAQQAAEIERAKQNSHRGPRMQAGRGDVRHSSGQQMPPPNYNRDVVGMDDLKKLGQKNNSRQSSSGPAKGLGPTSMFPSRSASGRAGLGPQGGLLNRNENASRPGSGLHSRTASVKVDAPEEPKAASNAFRYVNFQAYIVLICTNMS